MSKLSPMGQSMAALFTPESEKLRSSQKDKAAQSNSAANSFRVPGINKLQEGSKSQDSLGNPASPGYERLNLKQNPSDPGVPESASSTQQPNGIQAPSLGPQFIRLSAGWEKLLMAQKKLCEKAKGLFTALEGPGKYRSQRKASALELKSRGAILDLDVAETQVKAEGEKKDAA